MNFPWINSQDFYGFLFSSDVHHRFSLQDFPTFDGHMSPYRCAQNFDIVKLTFFFTFQSCWIITHILTAFLITFLTQFVKKRSSIPWSFLGLSSNVFTFDQLFTRRSDVFNDLAISLTKWPQYHKNRCLSCSTNSVCSHFRERVEKTKENGKNTKIENLQNGQEKYGGGKTCIHAHLLQKFENIIFSSNFSLKLLWTVILKNFVPLPEEALNSFAKNTIYNQNELLKHPVLQGNVHMCM